MRKLFAFSLVGLFLGVAIVALIEIDPGYVLVAYGNYTVETSLWVGTLVLLLFSGLAYLLTRLVRKTLGGKNSIATWLGMRKSRKGVHLTNRGLINFIEGNWSKSRQQLLRGAKGNEAPLLNYLIAARASHQLNETDKMREYLGVAEQSETDAGIAVELTQAEMKLDMGQYEQALATLVRARRNAGRHPYVLSLLRKVYEGLEDWQAIAELLPELKKYKVIPESEYSQLELKVHTLLFTQSVADAGTDELKKSWGRLPAALKKEPALVRDYLELLLGLGAYEEAGKFIVRSLKGEWDSALVRLYGFVEGANPTRQLAQAESWLAGHDKDAQLHLCLGRLSARNKLWGKARDFFESSYKLERSAEVCAELGRLLASLGEDNVSAAYFREGLLIKEPDLPELPMPDKAVSRVKRLANS
jgi:HemY protein